MIGDDGERGDDGELDRSRAGDDELAAAVRRGDDLAAEELFRRHAPAARRFARTLTDEATADDLVSEAFTRLLTAFRAGNGPESAVRPYLIVTLRNVYVSRIRAEQRVVLVDEFGDSSAEPTADDGLADRHESDLLAAAFRSLPERWQTVLWHSSVEGEGHEQVGRLLGLSANAVGALAFRAREGLRRAYLEAHLASATDEVCRSVRADLPAYVRDRIDPRRRRTIDAHLQTCAACTAGVLELAGINDRLGALLVPALLGAEYARRYVTTIGGDNPPDVPRPRPDGQAAGGAAGWARRHRREAAGLAAAVIVAVAAGWWALAAPAGNGTGSGTDGGGDAATSATGLPTPGASPSTSPSSSPTDDPTDSPTADPGPAEPSVVPAVDGPGTDPAPTTQPTPRPTGQPTRGPSGQPTSEPTREPSGQPTSEPTSEPAPPPDRVSLGGAYQSDFGPYRHVQLRPSSPFAATYVRLTVAGLRDWTLHTDGGYRPAECTPGAQADVLVCHVGAGDDLFGIDLTVDGGLRLSAEVYAEGYDDPQPGNNRVELRD